MPGQPSAYRLAMDPADDQLAANPDGIDHTGKAHEESFAAFKIADGSQFGKAGTCTKLLSPAL